MLLKMGPAVAVVLLSLVGSVRAGSLSVGDVFPAWSLVDQDSAVVTSNGQTGRSYILWFYPAAMSPGCTAEARSFRDNFGAFQQAGFDIVGVSFDSPEINGLFAKAEQLPFPLLSDPQGRLARRVGAAESSAATKPRRMTFLVDENGQVVKIYERIDPLRHAQEILLDLGVPIP